VLAICTIRAIFTVPAICTVLAIFTILAIYTILAIFTLPFVSCWWPITIIHAILPSTVFTRSPLIGFTIFASLNRFGFCLTGGGFIGNPQTPVRICLDIFNDKFSRKRFQLCS